MHIIVSNIVREKTRMRDSNLTSRSKSILWSIRWCSSLRCWICFIRWCNKSSLTWLHNGCLCSSSSITIAVNNSISANNKSCLFRLWQEQNSPTHISTEQEYASTVWDTNIKLKFYSNMRSVQWNAVHFI